MKTFVIDIFIQMKVNTKEMSDCITIYGTQSHRKSWRTMTFRVQRALILIRRINKFRAVNN